MIVSIASLVVGLHRRLPRPALAHVHDRRPARLRARPRHGAAEGCGRDARDLLGGLRRRPADRRQRRSATRSSSPPRSPPGWRPSPRCSSAGSCSASSRRSPAPARSASTSSPARAGSAPGRSSPASTCGDRLHELDLAAHRLLGHMTPRAAGIYLDNAATSWPKPPGVLEAIEDFLANAGGNVGRAGHRRSIASSRSVSLARERVADLLGAETPDQVIFTKNATEGLNLAILGLVARRLAGGDDARSSTTRSCGRCAASSPRPLHRRGRARPTATPAPSISTSGRRASAPAARASR